MKRFLLLAVLAAAAAALSAQTPDWPRILARIDEMTSFENNDLSATITVVTTRPGEENKVIQARYFRRDNDKKFVLLILKPEIQKGQGYLAIDENLWFYDPESRKFAFSSLKDRFSDSGAQNSDFSSSKLHKDYTVQTWTEEKLGKFEVWAVVLKSNDNSVAVPKRKLWIRRDNQLVLKEEQYSLSDRLLRTLAIPSYQTVSGRFVPLQMLSIDNVKVGERAQITFKEPSVSRLPDSIFTKSYLERVNQ
jgi:outer membrane lipoprotein-sorting protein